MFSDQVACYEAIGIALQRAIPEPWSSIDVEAELDENSVDLLVMYDPAGRVGRGNIPDVPMLARYFFELSRLVSAAEKGFFKSCRYRLEQGGKYHAEFTY